MISSKQEPDPFRNPLIGDVAGETCANVHAAMSLLKQLQSGNETGGLDLTPTSNHGLYLFNTCILQAIEYEITNQPGNEEEG